MLKQIKNLKSVDNILFIPSNEKNIISSLNETFKNIIIINPRLSDDNFFDEINSYKIKKIYLWGYESFYHKLIPRLKKEIEVCWIFNHTFSNLSNYNVREQLHYIFEYYDRKLINYIGCLNNDNVEVFKNAGYNFELFEISQNYKEKKYKESNTIGLIGNDSDPTNNFYNQLASLTFVDYDYCKIKNINNSTKKFLKIFNIKYKKLKNIEDVIKDNFVNLYVNFTNTDKGIVKMSFSLGIPCIVGNTNLLDKNKYLKENLVLKSDDDITEISEKISFVKNNREKIIKEYNKIKEF